MNISLTHQNPITLKCSKGDTKLRKWEFTLTGNDEIVTPKGELFLVYQGGVIPLKYEDNKIYCDCIKELSSNSGKFKVQLRMIDGEEVISSFPFDLFVEGL